MDTLELMRVWTDEVWHAGRLDRVADCLAETYVRHDPRGNRVVTREEYIEEIRATRARVLDIHFEIDDFAVSADRTWTRYRMTGTDVETGEPMNRSALQVHRVEDGRYVETWAPAAPEGHDWAASIG